MAKRNSGTRGMDSSSFPQHIREQIERKLKANGEAKNSRDIDIAAKANGKKDGDRCVNKIEAMQLEVMLEQYEDKLIKFQNLFVLEEHQVKLVIPFLPDSKLNPNNSSSWHKKIPIKKQANSLGQALMLHNLKINPNKRFNIDKRNIECEILYLSNRRIDDDNALSSIKHIRDGIYIILNLDDSLQKTTTIRLIKSDFNIIVFSLKIIENNNEFHLNY